MAPDSRRKTAGHTTGREVSPKSPSSPPTPASVSPEPTASLSVVVPAGDGALGGGLSLVRGRAGAACRRGCLMEITEVEPEI